MSRKPSAVALGLLIAYATGLLVFSLWSFGDLGSGVEDVFKAVFIVAWTAAPAALAALLAKSRSRAAAWGFVGAQAAVICSTSWLWIALLAAPKPWEAQGAIGLGVLPLMQVGALLLCGLAQGLANSWPRRASP